MTTSIKNMYPLSSGQEAMWLIHQIAPESVAYNIFITAKIRTDLNIAVVNRVWQKIIEKHPILRTTYTNYEGKPVQQVNQQENFSVEVIDASEWSEEQLAKKIYAIADRPFNLEQDSVLRVNLFSRSAEEHIIMLTMHHIAGDMWTFDLLLSEFRTLYVRENQGISQEQTETVDAVSGKKSYADFIHWQSEMLSSSQGQKLWQYWQQQLAGELPILNLLPDRPRPPVKTYQGASYIVKLDEQLTEKLNHLAVASKTSLYQILLTAFYIQLYRYTNQTDILISSPMRGRTGRSFKEIAGYFANLTVLRVAVQENATFQEFLAQVSKTVKKAQYHQDYPFALLAQKLQPQSNPSLSPFSQVSFTWQRQRWCELTEKSLDSQEQVLEMQPYLLGQRGADLDLNLMVREANGVLEPCWQYNSDLFDSRTIERMAGNFITLLESIVANPQESIAKLPILTETEQHQLLVEWNDTQAEYPVDKCIHELFEEQVEKTPNAIAVVFENEQLTYQQLNSRANQLAHHLQSLGVKPETLVGICVERSLEMVIGLLGILKAGGAYVPLDPEYPQERLSFMLEDAQVSVLLTQKSLLNQLPLDNREKPYQVICLEQLVLSEVEVNTFNLELTENPNHQSQPENLAYVIYTSGSTGKPKGVTIEHRAIVNLSLTWGQTFQVQNHSRLLQFGSFSFDLSVGEITTALVTGACLYLGNKVTLLPSQSLVDFLTVNKITHSFLSPSALSVLPKAKLPDLQCITVGGEACTTELVNQWGTERKFYNCYGPTESTVTATIFHCQPNGKKPAIGKAISNIRTYILDKNNQLLPPGVPGELCIAGVGLARGYLNRPQATGEKFIEIDINGQVERIYKTGDLARYLADGNIEYIGRIDNQVKIRGFRIELGEIEAVLNQHPQIQTSCVIVREDNPTEKRLVGYIVPKKDTTPELTSIRQFLVNKLPGYMIPSALVRLENLPQTPNGKIDRRALPKPELDSTIVEKYVAPRNPIEELLTQTWLQVLKVESVGVNDNFFELGGHSLLATQIVSRIRKIFQVELPLNKLFAAPTVRELAHIITQLQQDKLELSTPQLVARAKNADLPMSFAQQRLWFLDQFEPNSVVYNIPTALHLRGKLQITALEQSLQTIIHRHEALRTNFTTIDGHPIQIIKEQKTGNKEQGIVSIVDLQHLGKTEQEIAVEQLTQQQKMTGFELETEALIRVQLILVNETEQILLVCMHHIVSDGWSMGVFFQELTQLYNAYCQNQPSPLSTLPIQYSDFAIWQREWLQGDVLQNQITYWEQQLKDAPTLLSLPTDRPRPAVQTVVGATHEFSLSVELTDKLIKLSHDQGCTLFMTLLAAYDTLLYRYTGQSDILVGSPIANRDRAEIEGLIGFFVNTLVMRSNLAGNPRFSELLTRVREMAMGAYSHQHLPFEMLVEALQPERDLSHSPLFQVMFNLQNAPVSELELNGLTVSSVPFKGVTAAFDMTLFMQNTATSTTLSTGNGLVGVWEYNTDLFDHSTIERMIGHFMTLLEAVVNNPQERIDQLPILTAVERQKLLVEWNDTQADYPVGKCLHDLFAQQVEITPDAVAVVFDDQQLTYQQLNQKANQLAHYLQSLGVGAEVLVGIYLERSLSMTVALLAVLKAGGGYVPLDVDYPQQRLTYISQDSQISVLITQESLLNSLPVEGVKVIVLDQEWEVFNSHNPENPVSEVVAENLACVLYTSGSTGNPKGVMLTHGALVNHSSAISEAFGLTSSDRVLQFAAFGFDVALEEIFPTWFKGGTVVLRPTEMFFSFANFAQFIEQQQITVLTLTSAYWHEWMVAVSQSYSTVPQSLRLLTVGGDTVLPETVAMWQQLVGDRITCLNAYGPTEASVTAIVYDVQNYQPEKTNTVLIGRPVANTEIYILDSNLQPVPIGVKGELYIGGERLARGYLNRPELTQEKFIAHPFNNPKSQIQNPKLYKTGDLARYLPDGNIEFIGRIDDVVKIRGFRVALGEIESLLVQHPDVICQVVMLREDQPGHKQLVAYVVSDNPSLTQNELQSFLKQKLPNYMIPTAFVMLEALPVTTNGKVDRRALPAPSQEIDLNNFVLPTTSIQKLIADIWSSVLGTTHLGIHNNFFDMGGNSLRAMQVMSLLRETLQIDLPLRYLFENPTVAELAAGLVETLYTTSLPTNQTNTISTTSLDLKAEAVLDNSIKIRKDVIYNVSTEYNNEPQGIFLTGVTGFLGSHLLYELLQNTQADIYCLIRAKDIEQARQKLENQLQLYKLWSEVDRKRIIPVVGDLGKKYLGLSTSEFQKLASQIDVIYHCGAWINVIYPYSVLKPANVLGTQEIIRLACEIKVKPLHYISTTSVLSAATPNEAGLILESDLLEQYQVLENGYVQSKWVAEKLVMQARDLGLPVAIYRASRITGSTQTGISNTDDLFCRLVKGCLETRIFPDVQMEDNLTPVDYVSKMIVHLSKQTESLGQAFHLVNPESTTIRDLFYLIRSLGYPVQMIPVERWHSEIFLNSQVSDTDNLRVVSHVIPKTALENGSEPLTDYQNTINGLGNAGIMYPVLDQNLLRTYISYFISSGFIDERLLKKEVIFGNT